MGWQFGYVGPSDSSTDGTLHIWLVKVLLVSVFPIADSMNGNRVGGLIEQNAVVADTQAQ